MLSAAYYTTRVFQSCITGTGRLYILLSLCIYEKVLYINWIYYLIIVRTCHNAKQNSSSVKYNLFFFCHAVLANRELFAPLTIFIHTLKNMNYSVYVDKYCFWFELKHAEAILNAFLLTGCIRYSINIKKYLLQIFDYTAKLSRLWELLGHFGILKWKYWPLV